MLNDDSTIVSEGKDVNGDENSCLYLPYHFKYFQDMDFKYETTAYSNCHYLMNRAMSFNKVVLFPVNGKLQDTGSSGIQKDEAINSLKKTNFTEKHGTV